jgi:hypothetical protein
VLQGNFNFAVGRKVELKVFTLAGLKNIKEVIKTVIYMGSDSENKFTKNIMV